MEWAASKRPHQSIATMAGSAGAVAASAEELSATSSRIAAARRRRRQQGHRDDRSRAPRDYLDVAAAQRRYDRGQLLQLAFQSDPGMRVLDELKRRHAEWSAHLVALSG